MIELEYVVGLVMAVVQLLKRWLPSEYLPVAAVVLGAVLNLINAMIFGGNSMGALKDGLIAAGLAIGIFSGVKNTLQARSTGKK